MEGGSGPTSSSEKISNSIFALSKGYCTPLRTTVGNFMEKQILEVVANALLQ